MGSSSPIFGMKIPNIFELPPPTYGEYVTPESPTNIFFTGRVVSEFHRYL